MKRIYKYGVPLGGHARELIIDEHAKILHVEMEYSPALLEDIVVFWAVHDDDASPRCRHFQIVGTGHPLPEGAVHRGTVKAPPFVWHLVELP